MVLKTLICLHLVFLRLLSPQVHLRIPSITALKLWPEPLLFLVKTTQRGLMLPLINLRTSSARFQIRLPKWDIWMVCWSRVIFIPSSVNFLKGLESLISRRKSKKKAGNSLSGRWSSTFDLIWDMCLRFVSNCSNLATCNKLASQVLVRDIVEATESKAMSAKSDHNVWLIKSISFLSSRSRDSNMVPNKSVPGVTVSCSLTSLRKTCPGR